MVFRTDVPRISEKILEDIRLANDIVEVIGSYLPLKKAGANFRALCPFHKEKTPSFHVHPQRQIFKCFGCGVGGNVFHFLMQYENVDFLTAVKLLAERAGIPLQFADSVRPAGVEAQKDLLYRLHEEVCTFYQNQLARSPAASAAREYVARRGLSAEMLALFRIGYAPDSWEATMNWALSRKYRPELLDVAGLTVRREDGSGRYDRFRGRLMFPICNEQGRVVGFSGRSLDPEVKEGKYVNSPESPIFTKGRLLFGLDKTKRAILDAGHAVVCEGQIDLIACYQAGVQNVVAPQGTAFTEAHGRILKRYVDRVILCFDADSAGQSAAVRSLDALLATGLVVEVAEIPAGHDPDSLVRQQGTEALRAVLHKARSYLDFHMDWLCRQYDPATDAGKVAISRAATEWIARIPNAPLQASYLQKVAVRLGVREDELREELRKVKTGRTTAADSAEMVPVLSPLLNSIPPAEKMLLGLMLADRGVLEHCAARMDLASLGENIAGRYIREIVGLYRAGRWSDHAPLLEGNRTPEQLALITELLLAEREGQDLRRLAEDCLRQVERAAIQAQIERLLVEQKRPNMPFERVLALQGEILDLRRRLQHISPLPTAG